MPVLERSEQLPAHRAVIKLSLTAIIMWLLSYVCIAFRTRHSRHYYYFKDSTAYSTVF